MTDGYDCYQNALVEHAGSFSTYPESAYLAVVDIRVALGKHAEPQPVLRLCIDGATQRAAGEVHILMHRLGDFRRSVA